MGHSGTFTIGADAEATAAGRVGVGGHYTTAFQDPCNLTSRLHVLREGNA
jgi:hypothetical protein